MRQSARPIGVFDSGIGGLTVVRALTQVLPNESIVYFGDTARVPYGTKSKSTIVRFSLENVEFLLGQDVKCIVVACNTSSAHALVTLRKYFKVPIIGVIRSGAQEACKLTRNKRIGVIGTRATITSGAYEQAIRKADAGMKVYSNCCPLFVPLVEEGWIRGLPCESVIEHYLTPLRKKRIDTLIMGCTHYPLLSRTIRKVLGRSVKLVDSGKQTAIDIQALLTGMDMLNERKNRPRHQFFVTDEPVRFQQLSRRFLGKEIGKVQKARWEL